jgi:retinol-binding protein 3
LDVLPGDRSCLLADACPPRRDPAPDTKTVAGQTKSPELWKTAHIASHYKRSAMFQRSTAIILLFLLTHQASTAQFAQVQPDLHITPEEKSQILDSITRNINTSYVFPEMTSRLEKALRTFQKEKAYANINSSNAFADSINDILMRVSSDKHLRILFSDDTVPPKSDKEPPLPDFIKQFAVQNNYGFKKIDILDGNIGYMNILGFFPFDQATDRAIAAFDFLENTQAMIIDMRNNSGGVGGLADFIISYFFDKQPVEFMEAVFTKDHRIKHAWSYFYVPGKRYIGKPVYILTSHATFSAGEAFTYIMQSLKRATIVGESTGGGANFGDLLRLNDHFVMNMPIGRPISPITKTNWEGIGVQPDIPTSQDKALHTAHMAALKQLLETTTDPETKNRLTDLLQKLQSGSE